MKPVLSLLSICLLVGLAAGCSSAESRLEKGDALYVQGQFSQALKQYRSARRKDPSIDGIDEKIRTAQIQLFLQRGDLAVENGHWEAAERAYDEVRRLEPGNPVLEDRLRRLTSARANAFFRSGQALLSQGNPFEAIPEFEQALSIQPDHPRAREALQRAEQEKQARETRAETRFREGLVAMEEERFDDALRMFTSTLELNPFHPSAERERNEARVQFAAVLVKNGDQAASQRHWPEALARYRQARELDPSTAGLGDRIVHAELETRAAELVAAGNRAFERRAWNEAYLHFDEARRLTSEPELFLSRFEQARENHATDLYTQAQADEREGRYREALARYRDIVDFHPTFRDAGEVCERLSVGLATAERAYRNGCRAQEDRDLLTAREEFRVCAKAIPGFRDVDSRFQQAIDGIARAQDFYERALRADARHDEQRARILFEECLTISDPYRDASDRVARYRSQGHIHSGTLPQYVEGCQAQAARNLEKARDLFRYCENTQPGYQDAANRLQEVESELTTAFDLYEKAARAEEKCELERARTLYEGCLAICEPCSDARERLQRVVVAQRALEEAQHLDRERKLVAAAKLYRQAVQEFPGLHAAKKRGDEIERTCADLRVRYDAMITAQRQRKFRVALSYAVKIRRECIDFEDIGERLPQLECEADYADGRAFERRQKYDSAVRCFKRCAKRRSDFRDVQTRIITCEQLGGE